MIFIFILKHEKDVIFVILYSYAWKTLGFYCTHENEIFFCVFQKNIFSFFKISFLKKHVFYTEFVFYSVSLRLNIEQN